MKPYFVRALPLAVLSALAISTSIHAQSPPDYDSDGLSDAEEQAIGSSPFISDSDGDGLTDKQEVYPFTFITGVFTYEEAMADAKAKGGWLTIIDSAAKLDAIKRGIGTNLAAKAWVGANDRLVPGLFQWVRPSINSLTPYDGNEITAVGYANLTLGSDIVTQVVDIEAFTEGRPFESTSVPLGTTIVSINKDDRTMKLSNNATATYSGRVVSPVADVYSNWATNYPLPRTNSNEGVFLNSGTAFTWGTAQVGASVTGISIAGGTGYTTAPELKFEGSNQSAVAIAEVKLDGTITATVLNQGLGYIKVPTVTVTGGVGLFPSGTVKSIAVTTGGTYITDPITQTITAPTITISGGGGSGAVAVPRFSLVAGSTTTYTVASIEIVNGGSGYKAAPTVTISGGTGGGLVLATPVLWKSGATAAFTPPTQPAVGTPGYGTPIVVTSPGSGYTSPPTVVITGGGGSGATAVATIAPNGSVTGVTVTDPGTDYLTNPTVTFSGGGGSGAAASAYIGDQAVATATISVAESVTNLNYILERPVTSPALADTDGDEIDDLTELLSGLNSPILADTDADGINDSAKGWIGSTLNLDPGNPIPYTNALVSGDYEGLVMDSINGVAFKQRLRLSATGVVTSSNLLGVAKDISFSGKFNANGTVFTETVPKNKQPVGVTMSFAKQANNTYYINGSFGGTYTFELRPVRSAGAVRKLTFEASPTEAVDLDSPDYSGSAVATGTVAKNGVVSFKVYLPDGSTGSYSGPVVDGNYIMLYVRSSSKTTLVGSVLVRTLTSVSDFDGTVKWSGYGDVVGQMRNLTGSNYVSPTVGKLGLTSFGAVSNFYNSVYNWVDGDFEGVAKAGAWASSGTITVPCTQIDAMKTSFANATGLVSVNYTRTDSSRALISSTAKGYAVALQSNQTLKGFYTSAKSGAFNIQPNTGNVLPDLMGITPMSKSTSAAATDYTVQVFTSGSWTASVPSSTTWVTLSNPLDMRYVTSLTPANTVTTGTGLGGIITLTPVAADSDGDYLTDTTETTMTLTNPNLPDTDGDGISDGAEYLSFNTDPLVFGGSDYGTVRIKLAKNMTGLRRTAVITIAGKQHTIVQDYR